MKKGYEENKDYGGDVWNNKSIFRTFYSRYWILKERSLNNSPSKEKQRGFEQITVKPERLVGVEVYFPSGPSELLKDFSGYLQCDLYAVYTGLSRKMPESWGGCDRQSY